MIGAGTHPRQSAAECPSGSAPHDDCGANFYAPDFITAVYRNILEASLGGFGCDDSNPIEREYLRRWSKELGPMLPPAAAQTLFSLVAAPIKQFTIGRFEQKGLITPGERIEWVST
jgi:hypothetical protein